MKKKKLLIYAQYFYPDVASIAQLFKDITDELRNDFEITIICSVPCYESEIDEKYKSKRIYEEILDDVKIIRIRVSQVDKTSKVSRIKHIISYFINSIIATFNIEKQDYIFAISQPPILGGVLGVLGKFIKKGKLIYNIQDFNPEQAKAIGYLKNKIILDLALFIDKLSCRFSDKVIVVGRDMQENLKKRFGENGPKSIVINNWINEKEIYPLEDSNTKVLNFRKKYNLENKFVICYSGNIGLFYDLENIIKITKDFKENKSVVFVFIGDGAVKGDLQKFVNGENLKNVVFIPYQEKKDLIYSLNSADIHWVVNAKGIKGISVPSKLYGVMAAGKPVLGVLEKESEARIVIEQSKCGVCVNPGEYELIKDKIKEFIKLEKKEINNMGLNGREYLENNLIKDLSIEKYKKTILEL